MQLKRFIAALGVSALLVTTSQLFAQQPIIYTFTPTVGSPGDVITLNGSGFVYPGGTVKFWPNQTATVKYLGSDLMMTVYVPSGTTSGFLRIQTATSTNWTTNIFTVTGPAPYVSSALSSKYNAPYGEVGDQVIIEGVHFTGVAGNGVTFNGVHSTDAYASSDTYLTVSVPSGATNGPLVVTGPGGPSTNAISFTVIGSGPFVTDFSPTVGTAGTKVYIDGVNFTGVAANGVSFNGVPSTDAFGSDTYLTVTVPAGVTTGPITVTSTTGSFTTSSNFFVPPTLTGFSPVAGRAGTNVNIRGINLSGTSAVSFNGLPAAGFSVLNNSNISAVVPGGASSGQIFIVAPAGSAPSPTNFILQPTVYGFTPNVGVVGSPITITGANFDAGGLVVRFNGVASTSVSGVSFGQLTATVPAGATTGPISVTTTDGSHTNSATFYLPPAITSFTPTNSAPGARVTVSGTNFLGASAVNFSGAAASSFNVTNNTTLGVTVPVGVLTGPIYVTAPAGTATSAGLYYAAPVITNFVPNHGLPNTSVTIGGLNFLGATAVRFNGLAASFTVNNNGQITATVPGGAQTGPITVVAPAGTNISAGSFVLDYTSDLSVTITNSVNPVTVTSNLVYSFAINNLGPYTAPNVVLTNTLPASVDLKAASISQGTLITNGNPIIGLVGSLSYGGGVTCTLTVAPRAVGNITNTVTVASDYPDPVPGNNTASQVTYVQSLPVLAIASQPNNQIVISWPGDLTNFLLQAKGTPTKNTTWTNVTAPPAQSNNRNVVTETNSAATKVYRLVH